MKIKNMFLVGSLGLVSALAFAGKPERDKAAELKPQIAAAEKEVATACGCPVTFDVKWDHYAAASNMNRINYVLTEFVAASKKECQTAEDKKAMCKGVKSVVIDYGGSSFGNPTLAGTTIMSHSNDSSYNGAAQFTAILSKF